jgi:uncharacterized cupredoxin-like copper-binding protein
MRNLAGLGTALVAAVVATAALAACGRPVASSGQMVGNVREFTVEGGDFYFAPRELTAFAGDRVRIIFTNVGKIPHEVEISRLGATDVKLIGLPATIPEDELQSLNDHAARGTPELWLPAGGRATVEFTVVAPGAYNMTCEIEGHVEAGMAGTFTVK